MLDGDKVFKLYDTYGFPVELTEEILTENGFTADIDGFHANMKAQKEKARAGKRELLKKPGKKARYLKMLLRLNSPDTMSSILKPTVLAITRKDGAVDEAEEGDTVTIFTDRSPFYVESGGQVSDNGSILADGMEAKRNGLSKNKGVSFITLT